MTGPVSPELVGSRSVFTIVSWAPSLPRRLDPEHLVRAKRPNLRFDASEDRSGEKGMETGDLTKSFRWVTHDSVMVGWPKIISDLS